MLRDLAQDLRVAARTFAARPAFTLAAAITVALAIGANTVVFGILRGLVLRPLPYAQPERLVAVWPDHFVGYRELLFLRENGRSFADVAGFVPGWSMTLTGSGDAAKLGGARVTANLMNVLGVAPVAGRALVPDEETPGANNAVILSGRLWRGRFGGDPSLAGRQLILDGTPHTVAGVMPPSFEFYRPQTDVWRVLANDPDEWYYGGRGLLLVGRLKEGVTLTAADAELKTLAGRMRETFEQPDDYGLDASVTSLQDWLVGPVRPMLLVALGAVGFVLLLAGANLANLLLARAAGREREIAVRTALGAGRGRLVRQLLSESGLLAVLGGAGGLAVAYWGLGAATRLLPANTPLAGGIGMDPSILGASVVLTVGTGILFGLAPAVLAVRTGTAAALRSARGSGIGMTGRRTRNVLVAGEVALGTVLLAGAALMLQTLWRLQHVDPGYRLENVLTLETQLDDTFETAEQRVGYYETAFEKLRAIPEVRSVGAIQHLPLTGSGWASDIEVEGQPIAAGQRPPRVAWRIIGGDYFEAMGIPVVAGRAFGRQDRIGAEPVVIVNEQLARARWPNEAAIGKRFRATNATGGAWARVIGVVADVRHDALSADPDPEMYRPITQYPHGGMTLVIHTAVDPHRLVRAATEALWSVDRDVPIAQVRAMTEVAGASVAEPRTVLILLGTFAFVGLVLGAVGTYGVVAYHVSARTREIGIRIALGAAPVSVVGASLRQGVRLAVAGAVAGVVGALLLGRILQAFVFDVSTNDPLTLGGVALALVAITMVASWIPARRAARIDPIVALREE